MIVFSSLQIRRGVRVLLDNATATINPGQKVGLVGKNGCGKSTLLALLKNELSADAGGFTYPGNWQLAWVNQETPALPQPALEYVIDGDREYRQLEAQLNDANERNDGHAIATVHGKLDAIDAWTVRSRAASLLHGRFKQNTVRDRVLRFRMGIQQQDFRWLEHHPPPGFVFCLFSTFWATIAPRCGKRPAHYIIIMIN